MSATLIQENFTKADFRQHFQPMEGDEPMHAGPGERHWFLDSVYGRDVLKAALRAKTPAMYVSKWKHASELDEALKLILEELGLQDLPEPMSMMDHVRYVHYALKMTIALENGLKLPPVPCAHSVRPHL